MFSTSVPKWPFDTEVNISASKQWPIDHPSQHPNFRREVHKWPRYVGTDHLGSHQHHDTDLIKYSIYVQRLGDLRNQVYLGLQLCSPRSVQPSNGFILLARRSIFRPEPAHTAVEQSFLLCLNPCQSRHSSLSYYASFYFEGVTVARDHQKQYRITFHAVVRCRYLDTSMKVSFDPDLDPEEYTKLQRLLSYNLPAELQRLKYAFSNGNLRH